MCAPNSQLPNQVKPPSQLISQHFGVSPGIPCLSSGLLIQQTLYFILIQYIDNHIYNLQAQKHKQQVYKSYIQGKTSTTSIIQWYGGLYIISVRYICYGKGCKINFRIILAQMMHEQAFWCTEEGGVDQNGIQHSN